ncbi:MAG: multiheme c-type cytochrome [Bryobacteraceae bacterium]|nr:multiheme c-type cytochrome [Bryobacteraceae bacterium]
MRNWPPVLLVLLCIPLPAQQYIGAGGCASSNCHGGTVVAEERINRIQGNEFALWSVPDKHSKASKVLSDARSRRMAEILRIASPTTDKQCTSCHMAGSPERIASDGVACEGCHGPAEKWLGPHTVKNSHAASVAAGMIDTKDLQVRARTCLGCHLGDKDRVVTHEMIAAGHPDLVFELDTFSAAQPMHHREPKPDEGNALPRVRIWAVGQAVALAEGMKHLARRASSQWPEFAELECYQCHHDLRAESWRIARGYAGRKPGALQVNLARWDVARVLITQAGGDQRAAVESAFNDLAAIVAAKPFDGAAIAQAASRVAQQSDALAARFAKQNFNDAAARGMVKALLADVGRIAGSGAHSAEQATMALDALMHAVAAKDAGALNAVTQLYNYLEHPSTYQPAEFADRFRRAAAAVN